MIDILKSYELWLSERLTREQVSRRCRYEASKGPVFPFGGFLSSASEIEYQVEREKASMKLTTYQKRGLDYEN